MLVGSNWFAGSGKITNGEKPDLSDLVREPAAVEWLAGSDLLVCSH